MTKKDYKLIAKALARSRPFIREIGGALFSRGEKMTAAANAWHCAYANIANALADHNPTFDRVKFREACFEERL